MQYCIEYSTESKALTHCLLVACVLDALRECRCYVLMTLAPVCLGSERDSWDRWMRAAELWQEKTRHGERVDFVVRHE